MNIFICDDSAEQISLCKKTLQRLSTEHGVHTSIQTFPSGEALLFEAEDSYASLDLIYLDIRMPGLDGIATAKRLREIGYLGDIVFFTGTYNSIGPVSHVAIYVGDGMMIHAGNPIQYASMNTSYFQSHFYAFGRLPRR